MNTHKLDMIISQQMNHYERSMLSILLSVEGENKPRIKAMSCYKNLHEIQKYYPSHTIVKSKGLPNKKCINLLTLTSMLYMKRYITEHNWRKIKYWNDSTDISLKLVDNFPDGFIFTSQALQQVYAPHYQSVLNALIEIDKLIIIDHKIIDAIKSYPKKFKIPVKTYSLREHIIESERMKLIYGDFYCKFLQKK